MVHRMRELLRWASGVSLLVAAGSIVAAMNWHGTWRSFALVSAEPTSLSAVEAQATFQQWVIVALIGLAVAAASCLFPVPRAENTDSEHSDVAAV